jgi:hypothetical protein
MDFSMFVFALVLLFTPSDFAERLASELDRSVLRRRLQPLARRSSTPLRVLGTVIVLAFAIGRGGLLGGELWAVATWGIFLIVGSAVVAMGLATLASYRRRPAPSSALIGWRNRVAAPQLALVVLLLLNAASPYLGGKTTSSFTMFSNLRTEDGVSNHLFLPRAPVSSPQDDLVRIHDSTNDVLQGHAERQELIAYHELRRALRADPSASVRFTRSGQVHSLESADLDPELVSLPLLQRKLLHFRPLNAHGPPICQA